MISQPGPGTAQESYSGGSLTPSQLLRELHPRLAGEHGSFVVLGTLDDLLRRAQCVLLNTLCRACGLGGSSAEVAIMHDARTLRALLRDYRPTLMLLRP